MCGACGGHLEPARACGARGSGPGGTRTGVTTAKAMLEEARFFMVGHSSLKAALDRELGGAAGQSAGAAHGTAGRGRALDKVAGAAPASGEIVWSPAGRHGHDRPDGHTGAPNPTRRVALGARASRGQAAQQERQSIEDADMRHGRKRSARTCNGFRDVACSTWIVRSHARSWSTPRTSQNIHMGS